MKIVENTNQCEFREILYGEVFKFTKDYYLCIELYDSKKEESHSVGVNLATGIIVKFQDTALVSLCPNAFVCPNVFATIKE